MKPADTANAPDAPFVHLFVARSVVDIEDVGCSPRAMLYG
jgi:hypothetical protein